MLVTMLTGEPKAYSHGNPVPSQLFQYIVGVYMYLSNYDFDKFFESYDVTEDGKVFEKSSGKEIKQYVNNSYLEVHINRKDFCLRFKVHRLVAKKFLVIPEELKNLDLAKIHINHIDGNKKNNCVSNLEWCTAYHNNLHARLTGLNNISGSNHNRWLDPEFSEKTRKHMQEAARKSFASGTRKPKSKYKLISPITGKSLFLKEASAKLGISYSKGYRHLQQYLKSEENIFALNGYKLEGASTIEKDSSN